MEKELCRTLSVAALAIMGCVPLCAQAHSAAFDKQISPLLTARHAHFNCMLAGRGGGTLSPGRYLKYPGLAMSNLWLSLMDRMGVEVERHGDSTGRLPGLNV